MIVLDFSGIKLRLRQDDGRTSVFDPVRRKWILLTPEEHVRQYLLQYLIGVLGYPPALVAVEKAIAVGKMKKRFDIVVYSQDHRPWMLVECKAPEVQVTEKTLHQLLAYQSTMQCNYWVLSNGHETLCADARDNQNVNWLYSLPAYQA